MSQYYMLIASLPALPSRFDVERTPASRQRLSELLKQLSDEDAQTVRQLAAFFSWDRQVIEQTEAEIDRRDRDLVAHSQPVIREIVDHRINLRTIVAALRRRLHGLDPPSAVGDLVETIRRNWHDPAFGMSRRFPWIEPFLVHLRSGEITKAERMLFEFSWNTWSRMAAHFSFSFEAIPLYIARWEIVDRWTSRDRLVGQKRFEQLTSEALGRYANVEA